MRILHMITRLILGGAQENTLLSVCGQQEAGHSVRLVCGPTTGPEGSLVAEARARGVDYVEVPSLVRAVRPWRDIEAYRALRRCIQAYRPDVVHTHSSKAGVLGRVAAWRENVPFVVHTIHGLPFHPYQSGLAYQIFAAAERFAARRCHQLVAVADAMRDQAVAAGVAAPDKFVTVYSGMEMEPFLEAPADRKAVRAAFGLAEEDVVIGKVARLFRLKGHEDLFAAFARLQGARPRLRLLLVGDGTWRARLEARARDLGIRDRCVFAGLIPHDRVADTIHAMDVVVHCSLREGLARVLPQALLAGRPVVSYDVDGAREVVIDGQTGQLVPPRDIDALVSALGGILADPAPAQRMAQAGRERCRTRFDWRHMVDRLLALYAAGLEKA